MPQLPELTFYAFLLSLGIMTAVWWRQLYTHNAGIVDGWWSYNFGLIAVLCALLSSGDITHRLLIASMVTLWSFRLGTHLLIRNTTHVEEDIRYRKLRLEYGANEKFRMWLFFFYQAISNVILSVPFLLIAQNQSPTISSTVWVGMGVWVVALAGESLADQQLKTFKKNPQNKGRVCQCGLWKYSRHPNYFFEWLIWVAYALIAFDSPYGWLAIACPLLMYVLLNKVTGIPMLEDLAVKSKGEAYIRYQQTTSAFFPWFKR